MLKGLRAMMLWRQSPVERMCLQQRKNDEVASGGDNLVLKYYGTRISLSSQ